jgi:hypothetical protein
MKVGTLMSLQSRVEYARDVTQNPWKNDLQGFQWDPVEAHCGCFYLMNCIKYFKIENVAKQKLIQTRCIEIKW